MTPKAQKRKAKNKQMGLHQTKKLLHSKTISKMKRQCMESEEICANHIFSKGLKTTVYKEFITQYQNK